MKITAADRGHFLPRPIFGFRKPGCTYIPRPGAYAVILKKDMEVAVIQVRGDFFLPGGGIQPGELAEEALQREAVEECGWSISVGSLIGEAVDYIEVQESGPYYEIQSRFFRAELIEILGNPQEPDHQLVWLPTQMASSSLKRQSQAWIIGMF